MLRRHKRVLALVRVSGDPYGGAEDSHEAQAEQIASYCRTAGEPDPIIIPEVRTATRDTIDARPVLVRLLADMRPGDLLVTTKQDRLSRNTLVYLQIVREITARGADHMSLAERFDTSTPAGKLAATMVAGFAEHEAAQTRDRMVGTRKRMRDHGLFVEGLPPIGYRREERKRLPGGRRAPSKLSVVPEDAAIVRDAARRCVAGQSIERIMSELALPIGSRRKAWDKKSIGSLLRSRFYLGEALDARGVWIPGAHEAILDRATYASVQEALDSRRNRRGPAGESGARTEAWLMRGIAVCGLCGARMGSAYRSGANGYIDYYVCVAHRDRKTCTASLVRVDAADHAAALLAVARLAELRELLGRHVEPVDEEPVRPLADRRADIAARRERLLDMAERGAITVMELQARLAKLDARVDKIAADEARLEGERRARAPEVRRELLRAVESVERGWLGLSVRQRRELLQRFAARIELVAGAEPRIAWRPIEDLVATEH